MATGFDVRKIALLASLGLTDEEASRLEGEFARILEFVEQVRALPLEGLPPSVHAHAPALPLRADEPRDGLAHEEAIDSAPAHFDGHFRTPPTLNPGQS